jgi:hypothetical protein
MYSCGGYTGFPYPYALFFAFMSFEPAIDGCLIGTAQHTFNVSEVCVCFGPAVNGERVTMAAGAKHYEVLFFPVLVIITTAVHMMYIYSGCADSLQEVAEHAPAIVTIFCKHVLSLAMRDQFVLVVAFGFYSIRLLGFWFRVHHLSGMCFFT